MTAEQRRKHCRQFLTNFVAGDNDAFNEFYQLLYPALFRFGLTVTNQREEVRDQLQDLFVWVYENAGRLLQKTDPELYLLAAIRNRIRKRLNRRRLFPTAAEELHALVTTEPAFTDKMQTEEEEKRRRTALAQQLAALPSRQQQVIYLRFYEGKS
ncbi:MAG: sigma-70 family RNA polymerase sigma factor, partial [Bacteroidota bacterium]